MCNPIFYALLIICLTSVYFMTHMEVLQANNRKCSGVNNNIYDREGWNDVNGWSQGLHALNPTRLNYILNILKEQNVLQNASILDVGCGGGLISNKLSELGYSNIYAFDKSENAIKQAKMMNTKGKKVKYSIGNIEKKISHKKDKFDVILLMDVLDHVSDIDNVIKETKRVSKKKVF